MSSEDTVRSIAVRSQPLAFHYIHDKHWAKAHWLLKASGEDVFNVSVDPVRGIRSEARMDPIPHLSPGTDTHVVWRIYRRVIKGTNYFGTSNNIKDLLEAECQEATIDKMAKQHIHRPSFPLRITYSDATGRQLETRSRIDWNCATHNGLVVHLKSHIVPPRSAFLHLLCNLFSPDG
jgi:hypothetical protein